MGTRQEIEKRGDRVISPLDLPGWLEGLGFEFLFHFCYSLLQVGDLLTLFFSRRLVAVVCVF